MSSYVAYDRMKSLIIFEYEIPTISEFSFIGQQFSDMINAVFSKGKTLNGSYREALSLQDIGCLYMRPKIPVIMVCNYFAYSVTCLLKYSKGN